MSALEDALKYTGQQLADVLDMTVRYRAALERIANGDQIDEDGEYRSAGDIARAALSRPWAGAR